MVNSAVLSIMALPFTISAELRFIGHCQHFQPLDIVEQKPLEDTGQHAFGFLVARLGHVVHQVQALASSPHHVVNTWVSTRTGFHLALTNRLDCCLQKPKGSHDAANKMADISQAVPGKKAVLVPLI